MSGTPGHLRFPRRGRRFALVLAVAVSGVAACTSDKPSAAPSSPPPSSSSVALSTAIPALPQTPPATAPELAKFMADGFAETGYARITFSTALSGNSLTGGGDVELGAGLVTGLDVRATVSKVGAVHYLLVDNVPYAALPAPAGKPYVVLGSSAGDEKLDRTAIGLQATKLLAAPSTYRTLVLATDSLTLVGRAAVHGTPALHYRGPVTVAKIPSSDQVRIALGILDVTGVQLDLWVDGRGRPLRASAPAPDGRNSDVVFSAINHRFVLAAPPADQVEK